MRHQPFVQALSECRANRSEWAALCSGLLVLRHFDDWLTAGAVRTPEDAEAVARVRAQIESIPESAKEVRRFLAQAIDVLSLPKPKDLIGAVKPLLAYGAYLRRSRPRLGEHVLGVVTEVVTASVV